jgi:RimJ/RimL family protein N-acetyltransferase
MNADPEVMEHFPEPLSRQQSNELIEKIEAGFEANGFGLWALEVRATGELIGFTGLAVPELEAPFTPAVEVGWRLARFHGGMATRPRLLVRRLTLALERPALLRSSPSRPSRMPAPALSWSGLA